MPAQLIKVTPTKAKDGQIEWTLCHKPPAKPEGCGVEPNYPAVILDKDSGEHVFTVTINDPSNLGVIFSTDPLWIQANTKPKQHVIDNKQIFDVTPGSTKLVFKDRNEGNPVDLIYQLNFVGADQKPVTAIDPDIKNGGSTVDDYNQTALLLGVIALFMLVGAIWLGVVAMRRKAAASGPAQDDQTSAADRESDAKDSSGGA